MWLKTEANGDKVWNMRELDPDRKNTRELAESSSMVLTGQIASAVSTGPS